MKIPLLLLSAMLLSAPTLAATPGQCGSGFDKWDLNCDGKIDGDEAEESNRAYHEYNNARHIPAAREGISDAEVAAWNKWAKENISPNQSGTWVKVSKYTTDVVKAGDYSLLLTPDSEGKECTTGTKGIIMGTTRPCTSWNSGGWHCQRYGAEEVTPTSGYKAECR